MESVKQVYCPYCGLKQNITFDKTDKTMMLKAECAGCKSTWLMGV